MSTKLETETSAAKTIQAYKDAAAQIGLVLKPGDGLDSGDFPRHAYTSLRYIRRVNAIGKEHRKIIRNMSRALVTVRDDKGKFTKKEVLWYSGDFRAANHRGLEYGASFEIGKYSRPKIVPNGNLIYNPKTGEPLGNEKILSGQETVYEIDVPKTKEARKKLLDNIISDNDNHQDSILYYYRQLDQNNYEQYRDSSFTYSDFVNCSIEELRDMSHRGAGSKASPYYKDKEGNLKYKKTDTLVSSASNKAVYQ
jgi:hypothetical protein